MVKKIFFKSRNEEQLPPRNTYKATVGAIVIASDRTVDGLKTKVTQWLSRNGKAIQEKGYRNVLVYQRIDVWHIEMK